MFLQDISPGETELGKWTHIIQLAASESILI